MLTDVDSNLEAAVIKISVIKVILVSLLALGGAGTVPVLLQGFPSPQRGRGDPHNPWGQGGRGSSEHDKEERLDFLGKMLSWQTNASDPGKENLFLLARSAEVLDRAKQVKDNNFQFDSLADAAYNLLRASERIFTARTAAARNEDNDRREAALYLQKCYFRVQQAKYFADLSGEKEGRLYITHTRSLYQQARSAYDDHLYDRARMLGDASSMIVTALENIAHAALRIPDPPVIK